MTMLAKTNMALKNEINQQALVSILDTNVQQLIKYLLTLQQEQRAELFQARLFQQKIHCNAHPQYYNFSKLKDISDIQKRHQKVLFVLAKNQVVKKI